MVGRKHLIGLLIVAVVLAGTGAAAVLLRHPSGPFPSDAAIAINGFAAWPVDTPAEARDECAGAASWRKDPEAVAKRFASEVLGYPDPTRSDDYDARSHTFRP